MRRFFIRPIRLSVILLAVVFLLIFLHYSKIMTPFENLIFRVLSPVQSRFYLVSVKIKEFYSESTVKKDLISKNLELEEKVKSLTAQNAQLQVLLEQGEQIKNQLEFLKINNYPATIAQVIGKAAGVDSNVLILNKGTNDGIKVGLPVIGEQGYIIGKIISTSDVISQVVLINDGQSSLAATIQNSDRTKGVIVGEYGLSLKMELIPIGEQVNAGDVVVTSGLEVGIPRGLIVGQIEKVESTNNNFFKTAYVQPMIDFDELVIVSVLKPL